MSSINTPIVNVRLIPDSSTPSLLPPRTLIIGTIPTSLNAIFGAETVKMLGDGAGIGFELHSDADMAALIGTGTLFHRWKAAALASQSYVPIDLLLVKNQVATDTTTITFTAPAVTKGTLKVAVFDGFSFFANVRHDIGTTATAIATEVALQLNNAKNKPYAASSAAGVVTLTWVDGFVTESTPIHVKTIDTGLAPVVEHVASTVPTQPLVDLFDEVGEVRYTSIQWPDYYFNTVQYPNSFLLDRFNKYNEILDGVVYTTITDTLTNIIDNTATLQGQPMCFAGDRLIDGIFGASIGTSATKLPDVKMSFVSTAIDRLRVGGADVTDLVSGASGLADYTGGAELASLPYHNMPIANTVPSIPKWYWNQDEQRLLREANVGTWGVNRAANTEIIGDMFTMWKTDTAGNVNTTWTPLESLWTSSVVREYTDSALRVHLSKKRMTNGDVIFNRSMENVSSVENKVLSIFQELGEMCLCVAGGDAEKKMLKTLSVTLIPSSQEVDLNVDFAIITYVGEAIFNLRIVQSYK